MNDAGGWLWLAIDVGFVVIFGAGLAYGIAMWRHRPADTQDNVAPELREQPKRR